jgi:hypothetical protein
MVISKIYKLCVLHLIYSSLGDLEGDGFANVLVNGHGIIH